MKKELLKQYWDNYHDRTMMLSLGSFGANALIGIGKLIIGLFLSSAWFITTAVYYLLLCGSKGLGLLNYRNSKMVDDHKSRFEFELTIYKRSGIFICLLGVSYFFISLRMYFLGESNVYPYYVVYGVAAVAFYKTSFAIYGMLASRRMNSPLLSVMKIIGFSDACVSMVATQCALLTLTNQEKATSSSALLGMACSLLFLGIGFFMLFKKKVYTEDDIDQGTL